MEDFISCEQSVDLDFEMIFTTREMCLFLPSQVHINFLFSCEPVFVHWVLHQGSIYPEFERLDRSPLISNFTQVSLEDLMSNDPARRAIEDILNDWPVLENWRRTFIDDVIIKAQDRARNMPCHHNVVFLEFNVAVVHQHIFDEGRALNSTIQQLMEEDNIISCMIPATDSSIESLETKILTDIGTCSVCLEDFPVNGDCDGASMPSVRAYVNRLGAGVEVNMMVMCVMRGQVCWSVEHGCKFSEEMSELGVRGFGSVGLWKKYVDVVKTGDGVCGGGGVGCAREGVKRDGEKRGIRIGFIGQESVEVVFRGG
ncbi:hypothetical protein BUALT_BualtUnG0003400 [Buddleja alternifolia]|uniref:Uncharacterized protein n=1 Tax=Buddleja alternifolia TaxID=168488 RepID=A0AAV6W1B3_9LAMI|nr:hypothetical protein BUALT_BualtUnG0003400 [Buddleja alternifolia]